MCVRHADDKGSSEQYADDSRLLVSGDFHQ